MHFQHPQLNHYLQKPTGQLYIRSIRIGNVEFGDMVIQDRAGALHLQDLVQATYDHSEKIRRLRRNGTRYPEPLPLATPARLLSEEVDDFLKDKERQNLRTTTIDAYQRTLAILQRVTGNTSASRIDHTHIYQMWDLLRWAPHDFMTNPACRGLTPELLIAQGQSQGRPQLANSTLELHRRFLASFFNTLVKARAIPHSPMDAFKPAREELLVDQDEPDRLLSTEEVQKIFDPETFLPWPGSTRTDGGARSSRCIQAPASMRSPSSKWLTSFKTMACGASLCRRPWMKTSPKAQGAVVAKASKGRVRSARCRSTPG